MLIYTNHRVCAVRIVGHLQCSHLAVLSALSGRTLVGRASQDAEPRRGGQESLEKHQIVQQLLCRPGSGAISAPFVCIVYRVEIG